MKKIICTCLIVLTGIQIAPTLFTCSAQPLQLYGIIGDHLVSVDKTTGARGMGIIWGLRKRGLFRFESDDQPGRREPRFSDRGTAFRVLFVPQSRTRTDLCVAASERTLRSNGTDFTRLPGESHFHPDYP